MTTIIRIEHSDNGKGIFYNGDYRSLIDIDDFSNRHESFPTPENDALIMREIKSNEFCAFKSIEQLQLWVTASEINQFIKLDYKVLLIDVSTCVVGEYQILYKKCDVLQTKDISNLFI